MKIVKHIEVTFHFEELEGFEAEDEAQRVAEDLAILVSTNALDLTAEADVLGDVVSRPCRHDLADAGRTGYYFDEVGGHVFNATDRVALCGAQNFNQQSLIDAGPVCGHETIEGCGECQRLAYIRIHVGRGG